MSKFDPVKLKNAIPQLGFLPLDIYGQEVLGWLLYQCAYSGSNVLTIPRTGPESGVSGTSKSEHLPPLKTKNTKYFAVLGELESSGYIERETSREEKSPAAPKRTITVMVDKVLSDIRTELDKFHKDHVSGVSQAKLPMKMPLKVRPKPSVSA